MRDLAVHEIVAPSPRHRELAALLEIVRETREAARAHYAALEEIRDKHLWKEDGCKTWNEFCLKHLGETSRSVNQKILTAATVDERAGKNFPDLPESHYAAVRCFPVDMHAEILDTAIQTAPGGKCTAGWITQIGNRLWDARKEAMKEAEKASRGSITQEELDEEDEEDDALDEPEEADEEADAEDQQDDTPLPEPPPAPKRSPRDQAIHDAGQHPISREEEMSRKWGQLIRTYRKLDRLANDVGLTRQDVIEELERRVFG